MAADNPLWSATRSDSVPGSHGMVNGPELILGAAPAGISRRDVGAIDNPWTLVELS